MKHKPELVVIGLDGTVPSHIKKMMDNGGLPAFQTLTKRGCWLDDVQVASSTAITSFNKINLADYWLDGNIANAYFDDVNVH